MRELGALVVFNEHVIAPDVKVEPRHCGSLARRGTDRFLGHPTTRRIWEETPVYHAMFRAASFDKCLK
jgi:hypothetical protein